HLPVVHENRNAGCSKHRLPIWVVTQHSRPALIEKISSTRGEGEIATSSRARFGAIDESGIFQSLQRRTDTAGLQSGAALKRIKGGQLRLGDQREEEELHGAEVLSVIVFKCHVHNNQTLL